MYYVGLQLQVLFLIFFERRIPHRTRPFCESADFTLRNKPEVADLYCLESAITHVLPDEAPVDSKDFGRLGRCDKLLLGHGHAPYYIYPSTICKQNAGGGVTRRPTSSAAPVPRPPPAILTSPLTRFCSRPKLTHASAIASLFDAPLRLPAVMNRQQVEDSPLGRSVARGLRSGESAAHGRLIETNP